MKEGMVFAFTGVALRDDVAFRCHVTLFETDEADAELVSFLHSLVDVHLSEDATRFRSVHLIADEALLRRLHLLPALFHGVIERRFPAGSDLVGVDVEFFGAVIGLH